jgi:hypothetical protein
MGDAVGNFLSFGDYDIIAYLMVGLAMFMVSDLVLGTGFLYRTKWNTGSVAGIVLLAYLSGHLISIPSNWIFDDWAVKSCLKQPVVHLIPAPVAKDSPPQPEPSIACTPISWVYSGGFDKPAPHDVLDRIADKAKGSLPKAALNTGAEPHARDNEGLFHEAFVAAKHDPNSYERMLIFQRLYLLFRNMGFLALSAFVAVLIKGLLVRFGIWQADRHLIHYGVRPWMISFWGQFGVFLVLSVGLFDRFLFFYRLYALEVISAYAYANAFGPFAD